LIPTPSFIDLKKKLNSQLKKFNVTVIRPRYKFLYIIKNKEIKAPDFLPNKKIEGARKQKNGTRGK
jgi:hypothetical protein